MRPDFLTYEQWEQRKKDLDERDLLLTFLPLAKKALAQGATCLLHVSPPHSRGYHLSPGNTSPKIIEAYIQIVTARIEELRKRHDEPSVVVEE